MDEVSQYQLADLEAACADFTRDELTALEDYLIGRANEVWLRNGGGGDIDLDEEEQEWQRQLEVVQALRDELDEREYVPSPRVAAECARARRAASRRIRAPRRGPRRRGAGRPGHRSRQRANAPPSDDDGEPEPHPVARPARRASCCLGCRR